MLQPVISTIEISDNLFNNKK